MLKNLEVFEIFKILSSSFVALVILRHVRKQVIVALKLHP